MAQDTGTAAREGAEPSRLPPGETAELTLGPIQDDPLAFLHAYTARYGDIAYCLIHGTPTVILSHPDYIERVLEDNNANYVKTGTPDLQMLTPMLGDGLMTSDGESWLRQRRRAQPAFRRDSLQAFDGLITDATETMLRVWEIAARGGDELDVEAEMTRLTLNVVAQALFGYDISHEDSHFGQAVAAMNEFVAHFDPTNQALLQQFLEGRNTMRALVQKVIDQRRAHPDDPHGELLSRLMQAMNEETGHSLTDRQLQDQIFTFLMAGHETTAKALTWTFYLLDRHPAVAERLRAELREVLNGRVPTSHDIPRLTYTGMVLEEAMRLYPPVWLVTRMSRGADEIGGYAIAPGTLIIICPYFMHRHPRYWTDPEVFDPERFDPPRGETRPTYVYFPFGGGPRVCIGRPLAILETRLVLAMIAQRYTLRLVPGQEIKPKALVTLRPWYGMRMTPHALGS